MSGPISLWLDDVRPAPAGWLHVRTAAEARRVLASHRVDHASLDHDLGICPACTPGEVHAGANLVVVQSLGDTCAATCRCDCHETGYDLVKWMAETGHWPTFKPRVHSANPVGAANMRAVIERYWRPPAPAPWSEGDERAAREAAGKVCHEDGFDPRCGQCMATRDAIRSALTAERARVAGERAKEMEATRTLAEAAGRVVEHVAVLAGQRAHHLGCECCGSPDGVHTCAGLGRALEGLATSLTAWRAGSGE